MIANQYVGQYGIEPQGKNESDANFKHRVSGVLRDEEKIIEAHEVLHDKLYDDTDGGEDVCLGIIGAMAQAMKGVDYGYSGSEQIEADIASGAVVKYGHEKPDEIAVMMAIMLGSK